jgi:hypothetical protein
LAEAIQQARSVFLPMSLSSRTTERKDASSLSRFGYGRNRLRGSEKRGLLFFRCLSSLQESGAWET